MRTIEKKTRGVTNSPLVEEQRSSNSFGSSFSSPKGLYFSFIFLQSFWSSIKFFWLSFFCWNKYFLTSLLGFKSHLIRLNQHGGVTITRWFIFWTFPLPIISQDSIVTFVWHWNRSSCALDISNWFSSWQVRLCADRHCWKPSIWKIKYLEKLILVQAYSFQSSSNIGLTDTIFGLNMSKSRTFWFKLNEFSIIIRFLSIAQIGLIVGLLIYLNEINM